MNSTLRRSFFLLAALPALVPVYIIHYYGVNIPFLDEWDPNIAGLFIRAHAGTLSISDFFAQHNEHRILIPRIIFFVLGLMTHWNTIAQMYLSWLIVLISSIGVLRLSQRTEAVPLGNPSTRPTLWLWFVCNLLLFTPAGWENWLWGIGLQNVIPGLLLIAALLLIDSKLSSLSKWIGAGLICATASYTSGNGFSLWGLIGLRIIWSNSFAELRQKRWGILGWIAAFLLTVFLYFFHYHFPPPAADYVQHVGLLARLRYVARFLGGPISMGSAIDYLTLGAFVGFMMIALLLAAAVYFIVAIRRGRTELSARMLPWFCVGGFAILSATIASAFRVGLEQSQAFSSRYSQFAMWLPVALIQLLPMIIADLRATSQTTSSRPSAFATLAGWSATVLLGMLLILHIQMGPQVAAKFEVTRMVRREWKGGVLLSKVLPDNLVLRVTPGADLPQELEEIKALDDLKYIQPPVIQSNNAADLVDPDEIMHGEIPNGTLENIGADPNGQVTVRGWTFLPQSHHPADFVFLTAEQDNSPIIFVMADIGAPRGDLVQQFGDVGYAMAGWQAIFPLTALPPPAVGLKIAAWALNVETGKAVKLRGEVSVNH